MHFCPFYLEEDLNRSNTSISLQRRSFLSIQCQDKDLLRRFSSFEVRGSRSGKVVIVIACLVDSLVQVKSIFCSLLFRFLISFAFPAFLPSRLPEQPAAQQPRLTVLSFICCLSASRWTGSLLGRWSLDSRQGAGGG